MKTEANEHKEGLDVTELIVISFNTSQRIIASADQRAAKIQGRIGLAAMLIWLLAGMCVFKFLKRKSSPTGDDDDVPWTWADCAYFVVITMSTVG